MPPLPSNLQFYSLLALAFVVSSLVILVPLFLALYAFLQRFALKIEVAAQLKAVEERTAQLHKEQHDDIRAVETRLAGAIGDNRAASALQHGEVTAKIDGLNNTVQVFANEVNRILGKMEGQKETMTLQTPQK